SDRRMETLRELGTLSTAAAETASDACRAAVEVLAGSRADVPLALAYLREEPDREPVLVASAGLRAGTEPALDAVATVLETGRPGVLAGCATGSADGYLPSGERGDAPVDQALVLPLVAFGRSAPAGALVLGVNPHRALDMPYRVFAELVASHVSTALTDAL